MPPTDTRQSTGFRSNAARPRVGIPWRTTTEEAQKKRDKLDYYFEAVRLAGADPQEISLNQSAEDLKKQMNNLDGFVLPGSPADVDPMRYGANRHPKTQQLDTRRDTTDTAILAHALDTGKPVLAICYGCQILNVHLKGTLIQDIPDLLPNRPNAVPHGTTDLAAGATGGDQRHGASLVAGSILAKASGASMAAINSSHHQAIDRHGENLRVTAYAPDGVIEGVEWSGNSTWVVGVQWHPERMPVGDAFSSKLFENFVAAAKARDAVIHRT